MNRLTKILLTTVITLLVLFTLLLTALRFIIPDIDRYRTHIEQAIDRYANISVQIEQIEGQWNNFGPSFELKSVRFTTPDHPINHLDIATVNLAKETGNVDNLHGTVERITVGVDIWRSLLYFRWQLRDLTFYQLQLALPQSDVDDTNIQRTTITGSALTELLLQQFERFALRNSHVSFFSPAGRQVQVDIPQMIWLNESRRHRAEGRIGLSDADGQYGYLELRVDLSDKGGRLDNGMIYLQADDVNMRPWLNRWLHKTTGIISANFSLASWTYIKQGEIDASVVLLKEGDVVWGDQQQSHKLNVFQQVLNFNKQKDGWLVELPQLNLATDDAVWPEGKIQTKWFSDDPSVMDIARSDELRIRAVNLSLDRITPLMPIFSFLSPDGLAWWNELKPQGTIEQIALDIPLNEPDKIRFDGQWRDVNWSQLGLIPGVNHFSGKTSGSLAQGSMTVELQQSELPYAEMFRAPLEVNQARTTLNWRNNEAGFSLWSDQLTVRAKALWINGSFDFTHLAGQDPWLGILAGIRLYDSQQAWRYFPEPLMGSSVADYLTAALQGGSVDNATLIYAGDPQKFPYYQQEGLFEVVVPLRDATFKYQPDWPALEELAIDLDFINDGLWMQAPNTGLGKAIGQNISAIIPRYGEEKLFIEADVQGEGQEIYNYFMQTPLNDSVGTALAQVQVRGAVEGKLALNIDLDGADTLAKGRIRLNDNAVYIASIDSVLNNVSGEFSFSNGDIVSQPLSASWFGQPIKVSFNTQEQPQNHTVNVELTGNWFANQLPWLPKTVAAELTGQTYWRSDVNIMLPHQGEASYTVALKTDFSGITSRFPAPLDKTSEQLWLFDINATGDLNGFNLQAGINEHKLNSEWRFKDGTMQLAQAHWQDKAKIMPILANREGIIIELPALKLDDWLDYIESASTQDKNSPTTNTHRLSLVKNLRLSTPSIELAGQRWGQLTVDIQDKLIKVMGQDIDAELKKTALNLPWQLNINYLYLNPKWPDKKDEQASRPITLNGWPSFDLSCNECWFMGQRLNQLSGQIRIKGNTLSLNDGIIDTGATQFMVNGLWQQNGAKAETKLSGQLSGNNFNTATQYFGILTPLRDSPFNIKFDLDWQGTPWHPIRKTANGSISGELGKGSIDNLGGGRAGQLLRLVSFDALLRKLQFDFSDIFGSGFYFDSLKGDSRISNGVMTINDLSIDGLAANVAMSGSVDLVKEQLNLNVSVAPEVSAGVGVATAFVVNPIAGAIAYVGSKVLNPLWSKIFLIRYSITGSLDSPIIDEKAVEQRTNTTFERNRDK